MKFFTPFILMAAFATRALADLNDFDGGACRSLQDACSSAEKQTSTGPFNFYSDMTRKSSCVALLLCASPLRTVQQSINDVAPFNGVVPANKQPDFSPNIFKQHSTDGKVWTEQNYIDFYYGALSDFTILKRFPNSITPVLAAWETVAAWTGFCDTLNIPYQNLVDWFRYSSDVKGAVEKC